MRAEMYRLFAGLLAAPPDVAMIDALRGLDLGGDTPGPDAIDGAWQALKRAAEQADPDALEDEYRGLFHGAGRGKLMPYASCYPNGERNARRLVGLRRDLDALGIERRAGVGEPLDHVSAVCEAMGLIIDAADEFPREVQQRFFRDHVARWMGRFFADLRQARAARFYAPVGALGERFIAIEAQFLGAA
ncbi:MAG: molecular chaperone TorD family protein [Burkholderiales bacterium]|nr:molecular chaperone TorD family protein [Burkholderiales bacterium]